MPTFPGSATETDARPDSLSSCPRTPFPVNCEQTSPGDDNMLQSEASIRDTKVLTAVSPATLFFLCS